MLTEDNVRRYARALYPVALLLVLVPLADLSLRSYPAQFDTLQWRFQTVGLLIGNYGTILLGAGLLGLAGVLASDRRVLRVLGIAALVAAVLTAAFLVLFLLDAIQLRQIAAPNFKRAILTSSAGAMFTGLLGIFAWTTLGRGALAVSRGTLAAGRVTGRSAAAPLVVSPAPGTSEAV